jgi:hypothetical protein
MSKSGLKINLSFCSRTILHSSNNEIIVRSTVHTAHCYDATPLQVLGLLLCAIGLLEVIRLIIATAREQALQSSYRKTRSHPPWHLLRMC